VVIRRTSNVEQRIDQEIMIVYTGYAASESALCTEKVTEARSMRYLSVT
jgi:hypothetical protein